MNKSILIGISIAIVIILFGVYFISSDSEFTDDPKIEPEPQINPEPKRYTQSLSEAVTITNP